VRFFKPDDSEQLATYLGQAHEKDIQLDPILYSDNIETSKNILIKLFKI